MSDIEETCSDAETGELKYDSASGIKVYVGPDEVLFVVNKQNICNYSKFFDLACNGPFKESHIGEVRLPELSPNAFDSFLGWIYTGKIRVNISRLFADDAWWLSFIDRYVLATYLQCQSFGNVWLEYLIHWVSDNTCLPSSAIINKVYEVTTRHCGLQRAIAAISAWFRREGDPAQHWTRSLQSDPAEYIVDVMTQMSWEINPEASPFQEVHDPVDYRD